MSTICEFSLVCSVFTLLLNATCHFQIPLANTTILRAELPHYGADDTWIVDQDTCRSAFVFFEGGISCFDDAGMSCSAIVPDTQSAEYSGESFLSVENGTRSGHKVIPDPPYFETVYPPRMLGDGLIEVIIRGKDPCFPYPDSMNTSVAEFVQTGVEGRYLSTVTVKALTSPFLCDGNGWSGIEVCLDDVYTTFADGASIASVIIPSVFVGALAFFNLWTWLCE